MLYIGSVIQSISKKELFTIFNMMQSSTNNSIRYDGRLSKTTIDTLARSGILCVPGVFNRKRIIVISWSRKYSPLDLLYVMYDNNIVMRALAYYTIKTLEKNAESNYEWAFPN